MNTKNQITPYSYFLDETYKKLVTKLETKKYEIHHQFFRQISHFLLPKFSSLIN